LPIFGEKNGVFHKKQCYDYLGLLICVITPFFVAQFFFFLSIFKIITPVPVLGQLRGQALHFNEIIKF
jgi:hypothetical protein